MSAAVLGIANQLLLVLLVKATLLAALGLLAVRICRLNSTLASRVAQLTILALLLLPLTNVFLPNWTVVRLGIDHASLVQRAGLRTMIAASALLLIVVWAAGTLLLLFRLLLDLRAARRLVQTSGSPTEERIRGVVDSAVNWKRHIRLVTVQGISSPAVFGWGKPFVLIPHSMSSWPEAEMRAALHHELAHVSRHDFAFAIAGALTQALFWPNPLVRRITKAAQTTAEIACDDAALRTGISPSSYAARLVAIVRATPRNTTLVSVVPLSAADALRARLASIMDPARDRDPLPRRYAALAFLMLVPLLLLASTVRGWRCEPGTPVTTHICPL